jgi:hypothetical protein
LTDIFWVPAGYSDAVGGVGMARRNRHESATRESRTSARRRAKAAKMAAALGLLIALVTTGSARAQTATPEQKRACTPDVYRLCAGEIPNARAITACLRRQKASLSDACRAVFD